MTMRRLDRKRLYEVEKLGQDVDVGAALQMKNAIISATQNREGYKVVTDIVVDLGTSKDVVKTGGATAGMPVGTEDASSAAELSYICKLTPAVFGAVTQVETICLEIPTDGVLVGSTTNAYQLEIGDGDGKIGVAVGNPVTIHADMNHIGGAVGSHSITSAGDGAFVANSLASKYLYIAGGAGVGATAKAEAKITVGAGAVIGTLVDEITRITLTDAGGTQRHFTAEGGVAFGGSQGAGEFNFASAASPANIAEGIKIAINGAHSFVASRTDAEVTVTQSAGGVAGNLANFYLDAPGKTTDITVADFTGGTTGGTSTAMTGGKFLIRVTGFMTPDDL